MGVKVRDFVPRTRTGQESCSEQPEQWKDPIAVALSIYRGVTYTNTTYEGEKSNTAQPSSILKVLTTGGTSKGDVAFRCLSVHMFTVRELWGKLIISLNRKCIQMFYFRC